MQNARSAAPPPPGATPPWPAAWPLCLAPERWAELQQDYVQAATQLWNDALHAGLDDAAPTSDRRFAAPEWRATSSSVYTVRLYELNARTLRRLADELQGDAKTKARVRFAVEQWIDAASPSNYLALNPEAQRLAIDSGGQSLAQGLQHLLNDLKRGHLSQTDERQFEVGRNVATTAGHVVYENELFQLIEYAPLTKDMYERPILFVPPCINKYYILDLTDDSSLVRYTVAQGHRVYMISWRNADASVAAKTWDDYVEDAVIRAIDVVRDIAKTDTINALGFCIGGTLLATALAVLAQRGQEPVRSATLLTAFVDFSDTGVLDLFIDEQGVALRESTIGNKAPAGPQVLKGSELATTFNLLRPNELVWNYVVGNYLKGTSPPPFDLLYWNSDSTNLPGPMYCWYLRNTYLEDKLKTPGALTVCGEPVDLRRVRVPMYLYASRDDHIVPWKGAYASISVFPGKKRFVLGASGHIAGVVNPPQRKKRSHWVADALPATADRWLDSATEQTGSWWPDWAAWLAPHGGARRAAPKSPGSRRYRAIEPAPGRYVKEKA